MTRRGRLRPVQRSMQAGSSVTAVSTGRLSFNSLVPSRHSVSRRPRYDCAVASVYDFLGSALPWHERHCEPVVAALYGGDQPRARDAIDQAWAALRADSELSADERRALEYILLEFELSMANAFLDDAAMGAQFAVTLAAVSDLAPAGPLSDQVQAKVLLSMIGIGTRRGFVKATEQELDGLLARIPEEFQTPNIWYYVVAWAFFNDNLRYLELALERQTVETTGWNDDYYWLRTNLMYQLASGKATRLDVEKTLHSYRHPRHILDFRNLFLERCERAGLLDEALYSLLESREAELANLDGTYPERVPKVVRAVKHD